MLSTTTTTTTIIVPLYQYPVDEFSWERLHQKLSSHPTLNFIIVVNPNSGPGVDDAGWLPDVSYRKALPQLNAYENVHTVGYVRLDYCKRPLADVEVDIQKYASWSRSLVGDQHTNTDLGVRGIFFDETPNSFDHVTAMYLDKAGTCVRSTPGILGERLIVHNPGTVPDPEYYEYWNTNATELTASYMNDYEENWLRSATQLIPKAETLSARQKSMAGSTTPTGAPSIVIAFEQSYALWQSEDVQKRLKHLLKYKRDQCGYMVHSVPLDAITSLTQQVTRTAGYVYITDLCEKFYQSWGPGWDSFVDALAAEKRR